MQRAVRGRGGGRRAGLLTARDFEGMAMHTARGIARHVARVGVGRRASDHGEAAGGHLATVAVGARGR